MSYRKKPEGFDINLPKPESYVLDLAKIKDTQEALKIEADCMRKIVKLRNKCDHLLEVTTCNEDLASLEQLADRISALRFLERQYSQTQRQARNTYNFMTSR